MEQRTALSEKHGRKLGNNNGALPSLDFRPFDKTKDLEQVVGMLWSFYKEANNDDTGDWVDVPLLETISVPMHRCEALFHGFMYKGHECHVITHQGKYVGLMIYMAPFPSVVCVRVLYLDPLVRGLYVCDDLFNSLGLPVKKIIFQTRTNQLGRGEILRMTEKYREHLHTDGEFDTFIMDRR